MSSGTIYFQETQKSNKATHLECDEQRITHLAQITKSVHVDKANLHYLFPVLHSAVNHCMNHPKNI